MNRQYEELESAIFAYISKNGAYKTGHDIAEILLTAEGHFESEIGNTEEFDMGYDDFVNEMQELDDAHYGGKAHVRAINREVVARKPRRLID